MKEEPKKEEAKKINKFDGLVHNADGTKDFSDGGKVAGVNNYP
jgi:hypothetical protein